MKPGYEKSVPPRTYETRDGRKKEEKGDEREKKGR